MYSSEFCLLVVQVHTGPLLTFPYRWRQGAEQEGNVVDQLTDLTVSNLGLAVAVVASWVVVAAILTSIISRSVTARRRGGEESIEARRSNAAQCVSRKVTKRSTGPQSGERGSKR